MNTATLGLCPMVISWKEDSSTTATSSGVMPDTSGSRGRPILPPRYTLYPASLRNSLIRVVVVVLPSLPVTPTILQGHSWKNSSISEVRMLPLWRAS